MSRMDRGQPSGAVPSTLVTAGDWAWRLLALAAAGYAVVWGLSRLAVVVLPILAALVLSALLRPVTRVLHRFMPGWRRPGSPWGSRSWWLVGWGISSGCGRQIRRLSTSSWPRCASC